MIDAADGDRDFELQLAEYDEAMAAGRSESAELSGRSDDVEIHPRLQRAKSCLDLLERVWPRGDSTRERSAQTGGLASVATVPGSSPLKAMPSSSSFSDFRIVREIGRGGMGVVYEAEQLSLGRRVALKLIPLGALFDDRQLQRFQNEARTAALLDHPHIVKIYCVGGDGSVPYYAMQLIEGHTLANLIGAQRSGELASLAWLPRSAPDRFRLTAQLGIQACEALEHAHAQGIVHRDVKPANMLVSTNGHLWIADFGLARVGNDPGLTTTGDVLGTLRYMSPEQALGKRVIDHRTDIYSLGASLYEWAALTPMFPEADRQELLQAIVSELPRRSLASVADNAPRDLETILLKATAKEPSERYETAEQMADDLRCFLEQRPIRARRLSLVDRSIKWSRRNGAVLTTSLGTAALVLVSALFLLWREQSKTSAALVQANQHLNAATFERSRAEAAAKRQVELSDELRDRLYASDMKLADQARWASNPLAATEILERHIPLPGQADLRGFEWHYLWRQTQQNAFAVQASSEPLYHVAYSSDGELVATAGKDAIVRIFDRPNYTPRCAFPTGQVEVNSVAFSPDGKVLASTGDDGTIRLWEIESQRELLNIAAHPTKAYQVAFSKDGTTLFSCGEESTVRIWKRVDGTPLGTIQDEHTFIEAIAVTANGYLAAVGDAGFSLWNVPQRRLDDSNRHCGAALSVAACDDGSIAFGCSSGRIWIRELKTRQFYVIGECPDPVVSLVFSPQGSMLCAADRSGGLATYATNVGLVGTGNDVRWAGFSSKRHFLAVADGKQLTFRSLNSSGQRTFQSADPRLLEITQESYSNGRPCPIFAFSPDGNLFACANEIHQWESNGTKLQANLPEDPRAIRTCAFSPDGKSFVTGMRDGRICWWNSMNGERITTLDAGQDVNAVAFSPDGGLLIAGAGHDVHVWDAVERKQVTTFSKHLNPVSSLAFSHGGRYVASADWGGKIFLWQPRDLKDVRELPSVANRIDCVAWSPDDRWLASVSGEFAETTLPHTRLWDVEGLRLAKDWSGHVGDSTSGYWCVDFRDDQHLLLAGHRSDIRILSTEPAERQQRAWQGHTKRAFAVTCSRQLQNFTSVGSDGALKVWPEVRMIRRIASGLTGSFAVSPETGAILLVDAKGEVQHIHPDVSQETVLPPGLLARIAVARHTGIAAVSEIDSSVTLYDDVNHKKLSQLQFPSADGRNELVFSPDGEMLVVAADADAPAVYLVDAHSGRIVATIPTKCVDCRPAFSADGTLLATKLDNDVLVWDVATQTQKLVLRGHTSTINALAFSPKAALLASVSKDRSLRVWDIETGAEKFSAREHVSEIGDVTFSPDGNSLATCDDRGTVKLWSVRTGQPLCDLTRFEDAAVVQLQFSTDGRRLFWRTVSGELKVCDVGQVDIASDHPPIVAGTLDPSFGNRGFVTYSFPNDRNDYAQAGAVQSDGKIIVAGVTEALSNFDSDFALVRFNEDGSLDRTFGTDGAVVTEFGPHYASVSKMVLQMDGKILVCGYVIYESDKDFALVRYNKDGSLDQSFGIDGRVTTNLGSKDDCAYGLGVQSDGKIVVAGHANNGAAADYDFALVRYNTDGTIDQSFGVQGKQRTDFNLQYDVCESLAVQRDDKIVLVGAANYNTNQDFAIARYRPNGILDSIENGSSEPWGADGKLKSQQPTQDLASSVIVLSGGEVLAAGRILIGSSYDMAVLRYSSTGTLDRSFGKDGLATVDFGGFNDSVASLAIQEDGRIVLAGNSHRESVHRLALARLNGDGSIDPTFVISGNSAPHSVSLANAASSVTIQADGKYVVVGHRPSGNNVDFFVARYLAQ